MIKPGIFKSETVLQEAARLVDGNRESDYGPPDEDWGRTAIMWTAILGTEVTAEQAVLCMVAVKISRECHKHKRDNIVDGCGYFRVLEMLNE